MTQPAQPVPNPNPQQPQPGQPAPAPNPAPAPQPAPIPGQPAPQQQPVPVGAMAYPPGTPNNLPATTPYVQPAQMPGPTSLPPGFPPPPGQPAGHQPQPGQQPPATGSDADRGYPAGLSVEQMNTEQQLAYWRHYARHHEDKWKRVADYDQVADKAKKYDELVTANATDQEKAVAVARAEARQQALTEAGGKLVDAWIQAATAGRMPPESIDALLSSLNRQAFLTPDGQVDTAKVYGFVGQFIPQAQPAYAVMPAPVQQPPGQQPVPPPIPGYPSYGYGQTGYPATQPVVAAPGYGPPGYPPPGYAPPGYQPGGYQPAPAPDFGQGAPASARPSGLAAGRAIAAARFNKPQNQQQTATASQ